MPPMALTDIICKNLKPTEKAKKHSDEKGLYLEVMPNGSKYWRLKYRFLDKEKRLALGVYPTVSLKEAREKRDEAKKQLAQGLDPSNVKKEEKLKALSEQDSSFEQVAMEWHSKQKNWTPRHASYVLKRLQNDIFPVLGFKAINTITPQDLLFALRKIEERGAIDIAKRLRQTCGQIFRYAVAIGKANRDISTDLKDALQTRKQVHHATLPPKELPEFLKKLESYQGELQNKLALKLLILTFVRTNEVRGARWKEFDFEAREWHIPAERMKMREKHIVPLSDQTIEVLNQIKALGMESDLLFPSARNMNKPISENTMLYAIYRIGYHSRATSHGFRALASTVLNENSFRYDIIERQLAHGERNKVRASYNHAQYLKERHEMMRWWGEYINKSQL